MDWNLVITIAVFLEGLLLLRGLMELSRQIEEGLEDLDTTLAGAIQSVIEGASFEPINPIQQALANMLQANLQTKKESDFIEITRSPDGKFSSANDN